MDDFIMKKKKKRPWYLNNPELFMMILLIGCFLVGGSIAYTLSSLFCSQAAQAKELALSASCLITVAIGGIGGYLWLIKKSEEY